MKLKLILSFILISGLPLFSQQKVNVALEKQEEMIRQLQVENQNLEKELDNLDKEIDVYREDVRSTQSDLHALMSHWLTILGILLGLVGVLLGVVIPVLVNLWFDKRQKEKYDKLEEEVKVAISQARFANEKAVLAGRALEEIKQLKVSIKEMEEKVSNSSKEAENSAKKALASQWYSEAVAEKDPKVALELINRFININPASGKGYNARGAIKMRLGDYYGAKMDFLEAIRINPNSAGFYFNLGNAEKALDNAEGAFLSYNKSLELDEKFVGAYCNRGNLWKRQKKYDEAIKDFNKAIELSPKTPLLYRNRARCYAEWAQTLSDETLKKEYLSKAKEDMENAKSLSQEDDDTHPVDPKDKNNNE